MHQFHYMKAKLNDLSPIVTNPPSQAPTRVPLPSVSPTNRRRPSLVLKQGERYSLIQEWSAGSAFRAVRAESAAAFQGGEAPRAGRGAPLGCLQLQIFVLGAASLPAARSRGVAGAISSPGTRVPRAQARPLHAVPRELGN